MDFSKAQYTKLAPSKSSDVGNVNEFEIGAKYQCFMTWYDEYRQKQVIVCFTFKITVFFTGYRSFEYCVWIDFPREYKHGQPCGYAWTLNDRAEIQSQLSAYLFRKN